MKHKLAIHPNHSNNRRKHPKRCTLIVYHISLGLLFIGIILTIIGLTTKRLFHIYIYDHRNPAKFHHVHIPVGLFSLNTYVTWLSMEKSILDQNLEISVACILIGLSLAETEIEYIHDHGDMILTKVLLSNGLIETNDQYSNQFYLDSTVGSLNLEDNDRLGLTGEFALYLTPPLSSFFLLISADFIYLLSFLAVLIYFVRLCEKAVADRKQMKCAETTNRV
ncbi:hypothetical protein Smp_001950 [Schistosoma mansoni]|uniref:hypothetical protein n=1 Tax=Schistosoma mansoni TaxID=6183 RepID=UPI0001A636AC|nr:hypothetical protein Smp_001950 [Schistosoma mansoni]|eukprot:XP_018652924.1 hypothetical protein Smp_001950 [Schistosoma mansoni]